MGENPYKGKTPIPRFSRNAGARDDSGDMFPELTGDGARATLPDASINLSSSWLKYGL